MHSYDDLLRGVRTDVVAFRRTELSSPWTLRLTEGAPLTLCSPLRGEGWIHADGAEAPRRLGVNDVAIVRGPAPVLLTDRATGAAVPGISGASGDPRPPARTTLLVGTYRVWGRVARRLLAALPPLLVVPDESDDTCGPLMDLLGAQVSDPSPGQQAVLDRLLDWLLVCTLRDWFDQPEAVSGGLLRALGDDTVGPALRAMHAAPEKPWTLAALAVEAGVSRSTLAGRFSRLVGEPPLAYLTEWRMSLAAELLTDTEATVAAVARRVGYADAFGFSTAFKRFHGVSPSGYRDRAAAPAPA
ncbi:AraC family transcriptional regulator [Streptomyces profundus]|uniref:AraC family transcriptional regulator n=1 Tax=Streptomyces profundus TaxID=2867410 RepID=UPI001D165525|nr:AraC family transcriptional regulator [Streptomyces sp. MA3_2.13]UED83647.1 AraC family transcriptional regulator [Streptomyces sp. MA3_2.13]